MALTLSEIAFVVSRPGETDLGRAILAAEMVSKIYGQVAVQLDHAFKSRDPAAVQRMAARLAREAADLLEEAKAAATPPSAPRMM